MTGDSLVKRYQKIWDKYANTEVNRGTEKSDDKLLDRGFVFQFDEGINDVDVLFLGINPSYRNEPEKSKYYTKEESITYRYFKPFKKIEDELKETYNIKISWTHVDLLVFRETLQSFIKDSLIKTDVGLKFVFEQLEIAKEILEFINPKILVVSNTQARTFLGADRYTSRKGKELNIWMDYKFKFDYTIGTQRIIDHDKFQPYVFLTSMLSGQRALDNGSKERLIWHINEVLGNK